MTLRVVILNPNEEFLAFIDPDLLTLTETIEKGGLRTLEVEYKFQNLTEDKDLFKLGNKIWVSGDVNLTDCLYVINTSVENSIYEGNYFKFEVEEVLVELTYAPPFSHTEIADNIYPDGAFKVNSENGTPEVILNWNALNYWFGSYFNIGIVQKCLNRHSEQILLTGSMSLMSLLRQIEEESGNVFVTRYEKDLHTNVIHRYLDFLNPINVNKDWEMNIEYDFLDTTDYSGATDGNGNPVNDDYLDMEDYETDYTETPTKTSITNVTPANIKFRITKDGEVVKIGNTPLIWTNTQAGFTSTSGSFAIQLTKDKNTLGMETKTKSFAVQETNTCDAKTNGYIDDETYNPYTHTGTIPDDSYFEMYDYVNDQVLYQRQLNFNIGTVQEDVLDFGYNMENVVYDIDETDTVSGIAPLMSLNDNNDDFTGANRNRLGDLIDSWGGLSVTRGTIIPKTVQRITIDATSYEDAEEEMGDYDLSTNYWIRPENPNDNEGSSYEFLVATQYWRAPYTKYEGNQYVGTDRIVQTEYKDIFPRNDNRDLRLSDTTPKLGFIDSNAENIYEIYKEVCEELKEKETRKVSIDIDVANLREGKFNNYQLHDKVYIKVQDEANLITARVTKTTKEAHDIAKTQIELDNYSINTIKTVQRETYINAGNVQFTYPATSSLTAQLNNLDYISDTSSPDYDKYDEEHPANKLLSFAIYNNQNAIQQVFTKITDGNGQCTIPLSLIPGDYYCEIYYPGDEEYTETVMRSYINVAGTLEQPAQNESINDTSAGKVTRRNNTGKGKSKTKKTYWSKCGKSPDKKELIAICKPSGSDASKYKYQWYKTKFKNKCPICGENGKLVYDAGKKNKCVTSAGAHGRGYKLKVPEHEITCNACDSDFCGVTGIEKWHTSRGRLTTLKKPTKSNTNEIALLTKGKMVYGTTKVTTRAKNTTSSKTRQVLNTNISKKVKKQALNIVGDSKGWQAAKKIAEWITNSISYDYDVGFYQSAEKTLSRRKGNCCCQAELYLQMCDAAGCSEYMKMRYVHVCCGPKGVGHVYTQIEHKKKGTKRYVDPCNKRQGAWNGPISGWGSPPGNTSNYPTKPF